MPVGQPVVLRNRPSATRGSRSYVVPERPISILTQRTDTTEEGKHEAAQPEAGLVAACLSTSANKNESHCAETLAEFLQRRLGLDSVLASLTQAGVTSPNDHKLVMQESNLAEAGVTRRIEMDRLNLMCRIETDRLKLMNATRTLSPNDERVVEKTAAPPSKCNDDKKTAIPQPITRDGNGFKVLASLFGVSAVTLGKLLSPVFWLALKPYLVKLS
jgi:hypothetical protein